MTERRKDRINSQHSKSATGTRCSTTGNINSAAVTKDDKRATNIQLLENGEEDGIHPLQSNPRISPPTMHMNKIDLRKEYNRYCKLYSSEPLDIVAGPLEKASYRLGSIELDLKGRGLRGVDCIALGKILSTNSSIHHLNLSDCLLLPQGFQALLDGLGKNNCLQILELRGNNIQSTMVESLSTFLKTNHSLKQLLLEWNCLGSSHPTFQTFCEALSVNKGLEHLDLRNNQILDESGVELGSALKHNDTLQSLDLRYNSLNIHGAKAIWDTLQNQNQNLKIIELDGNFVPEEIVRHIQSTLSSRNEKEAILEDYSKRTSILTSQLQRTEDNYKSEIKNMLTMFEDEESGLKQLIRSSRAEIATLSQELIDEKKSKQDVIVEMNKYKNDVFDCVKREKLLRDQLQMKINQITELEKVAKDHASELGTRFEGKISKVTKDLGSLQGENDRLHFDLKEAFSTIKEKEAELSILNNRIEALKQSSKKAEEQFEIRISKEKENWINWKEEVESHEHQETQRLQNQLSNVQKGMQNHVKTLETQRSEAEEEVNRLKICLLTSKTEAEENLSRLRNSLNEQHAQASQGLIAQIETLKKVMEAQELEGKRLDGMVRKLESDMGSLTRQNEHLKQHNSSLIEELGEIQDKMKVSFQKSKVEVNEYTELANKEQEANKSLRGQVLDMQEQIAMLTMRLNRSEKERKSEAEYMEHQLGRRDEELKRLKAEDMRRAALLHDAFIVYMRSTAAATGLPIPTTSCPDLHKSMLMNVKNNMPDMDGKGDTN